MTGVSLESLLDSIAAAEPGPLAMFLIVAISGIVVGKLFSKLRLPDISGQVLAGVAIGSLFSREAVHAMADFSEVALGVMTFTVGTYLSLKVLHNARSRIFTLAFFDTLFTTGIVFVALILFVPSLSWVAAMLIASIATETAPAAVISLVQKKYARGPFTKTLIGVTALNNFATIIIFVICRSVAIDATGEGGFGDSFHSILAIPETILVGVATGLAAAWITKHQHDRGSIFATVFLAILANVLVCRLSRQYLHIDMSHLLANLTMGIVYTNSSYHGRTIVNEVFGSINTLLFAIFFTMAGTHLDLTLLSVAGVAGAVFVLARAVAKSAAAYTASRLFDYPRLIARFLGLGLIPQAGLGIGLVISLSSYPEFSGIAPAVSAIILAAILVNELVGPLATSWSIDLSGERGQATPRLVDFLHEEYILMPFEAADKWEAIDKMCAFLVKTNHLRSISREDLRARTVEREQECTTGIGNRLAIPHVRIPRKERLMGVIGICEEPIDFDAVDGEPVDIVILVATPEGREDLHVKVMGAIARIFADDPPFQRKLVGASGPAEVYDLLQSKQIQDINSYIEDA